MNCFVRFINILLIDYVNFQETLLYSNIANSMLSTRF